MKQIGLFSVFAFLLTFLTAPVWAAEGIKITTVMQASETLLGQKIAYPKTDKAEMTALLVEMEPGTEVGLHMHPVPLVVYVLEGTLDVEMSDGSKHQIEAGKAFLEVVNTWHNGLNKGKTPLKFFVVFAGVQGKENLIRAEQK
jgi:quercetin dioxygenase-like cupin family protein